MNDDIISKSLGLSFSGSTGYIVAVSSKNLGIENDFDYARENIKSLINNGSDAIDEIIKIAKAGDNPRAFEVVSLLLKTVADMNKDLIDLYQKTKIAKKEDVTVNNTTNNSIFVGSTSELQDLINKDRSRIKSTNSQHFLENNSDGK